MNNLNGSEKQIAWATDIRKEFIEKTKADMKSADKNDVLDMKAMLKVADNITEAADWINARRNPKIMFFDRADFWEARREIKAAEKPAEKEDSGRKPSIREMLRQRSPKRTVTAPPPRRTKSRASSTTSRTGTSSPSLRRTDHAICVSRPMTRIPAATPRSSPTAMAKDVGCGTLPPATTSRSPALANTVCRARKTR
ncbi:hypothetical protein DWX12_03315 [Bifidobacterium pseudocatenulatum]|nr:hypothetical protein DWX12_03315 [Bifidobacterium pseudocatenulatum]